MSAMQQLPKKKSRTVLAVQSPIGAAGKEAKTHTSMFMITINPNERFDDINSPTAKVMMFKLSKLSDFLLKKKNILASLKFIDRPEKPGGLVVKLPAEIHMSRVLKIGDERSGAVEWGKRDKKLHIHIQFEVTHRTFIQLNKEFYLDMSAIFLGVVKSHIHCNLRGATRMKGWSDYVHKNDHELKEKFFDSSAAHFYKEEANKPESDDSDSE